ncbi:MAG: L-threonylcarbamoyladenylate synthase [Anaerolineae bacterium]|nr:L-threonylcarbamoyladenylate synthase [Thermoflexales bacterium]MDW8408829.1 L-threonylcarbamoyladenylate synthase [Anaerolineae bacterium]
MTRLFDVQAEPAAIAFAAEVIRQGGLVAFPTETVYGLGANALDADAVAKVFSAKQRLLSDPLIVHVCLPDHKQDVFSWLTKQEVIGALSAQQEMIACKLASAFWPGPLTLVLPRGERIPPIVTAGLDRVAVRIPNHPIALELLRRSNVPIAAPSANRFGHVSPTTARHVLDDLAGRIDVVLDGGPTPIGIESTVVDVIETPPRLLRPGGLVRADIEALIGPLGHQPAHEDDDRAAQPSPGLLSRHYAPRAELRLARTTAELIEMRRQLITQGLSVGVLITDPEEVDYDTLSPAFALGRDMQSVARNLYAGLRTLDSAGVDVILIREVEAHGLGEAVADRLRRGARR